MPYLPSEEKLYRPVFKNVWEREYTKGKKIYTAELVSFLEKIWQTSGYISFEHLYHYIKHNTDKLFDSIEKFTVISSHFAFKVLAIKSIILGHRRGSPP